MSRKPRRLPSPALVISVIALIVAVGGGAVAIAALTTQKVKHIAAKEADKRITSCDGFGGIKGFARVVPDQVESSFSSHGVDLHYNCSGKSVQAKLGGAGDIEVRFKGNPAVYALANVLYQPGEVGPINIVTNVAEQSSGDYTVFMSHGNSGAGVHVPFLIMMP